MSTVIDVDTQEWLDLNIETIVRLIAISAVPPLLISNPPTSHGHSHAIVYPAKQPEHLFLPGRVINIPPSHSGRCSVLAF